MKFIHDKTGNVYDLIGFALEEKTLTILVTYRRADGSGPEWTRPAEEFFDGRFNPTTIIEQKSLQACCTCDAMDDDPCPVHYKEQYARLLKSYVELRDASSVGPVKSRRKGLTVANPPTDERPGAVLIETAAGTVIGHLDPDVTGGSGTPG